MPAMRKEHKISNMITEILKEITVIFEVNHWNLLLITGIIFKKEKVSHEKSKKS